MLPIGQGIGLSGKSSRIEDLGSKSRLALLSEFLQSENPRPRRQLHDNWWMDFGQEYPDGFAQNIDFSNLQLFNTPTGRGLRIHLEPIEIPHLPQHGLQAVFEQFQLILWEKKILGFDVMEDTVLGICAHPAL